MNRKYKLIRKYISRVISVDLKLDDPKEKRNFTKAVTAIGIITVIGAGFLTLTGCSSKEEIRYVEPEYSINSEPVVNNSEVKTSITDFENYDLVSLDKFCDNLGSLYYADDVISYRTKYEDIVCEKADKWGIDSNLAMAILTQESRSGNTTNLMQIGFNVWQGEPFRVYDFENEKYVDILLTEDPILYNSDKYLTINRKDLENPKTNISIGCAMIQNSLKSMNYNIPAGIQCYNYGPTSMNSKVFPSTFENTYQSRESILNDQFNMSFMNYTDAYDKGDNDYFYNVSRFLNPNETTIKVKEITPSSTIDNHIFDYSRLRREFEQYKEENKETIL